MSDRWIEPWDGATHPDVGTYEDESVADTPEVERYDPQLDPDLGVEYGPSTKQWGI